MTRAVVDRRSALVAFAAVAVLLSPGCIEGNPGRPLGSTCIDDEECAAPLVCAFGVCRQECLNERDCDDEQPYCIEGSCFGPDDGDVTCWDILQEGLSRGDGEYTTFYDGEVLVIYCDMSFDGGGWARVVLFDAAEDECPGQWEGWLDRVLEDDEGGPPRCVNIGRYCSDTTAASAHFEPPQASYGEVRGFVSGYQWASTDAFSSSRETDINIDEAYVDGVSITTGTTRQHLWTYAAALTNEVGGGNNCPCIGGHEPAEFVGDHYFCESANHETWLGNPDARRWFFDDPLWDDEATGAACAEGGNPSWFHRVLGERLSTDLEVRIIMDDCD